MAIFNASMDWERSCILASAVGTMRAAARACVAYAQERKQFGQPIGSFQAVAHRIVDMKVRLETARLLLYRLAWLSTRARRRDLDSALAKLYLSDASCESSLDALQVHGGYGYMTEYELEREVRDAIASRIYSGTSEIQRNIARAEPGAVSTTLLHELLARRRGAPPRRPRGRRRRARDDLRASSTAAANRARARCSRSAASGAATGSASTSTSRSRRSSAIYGMLKAGAAYVPLDPGAPLRGSATSRATPASAASSRARPSGPRGRRSSREARRSRR